MQKIRPDMDIGKNIQSLRYKNNLTQDQVIAKLNLMGIVISKVSAKYCYVTRKLRLHQNDRCKRFPLF